MRRIIRWLTWPAERLTRPLRRLIMTKVDQRVVRLVSWTIEVRLVPPILEAIEAVDARLKRIEASDRSALAQSEEINVVLNGLSREIFRLQARVERLRDDDRSRVGLALLAEPDDETEAADGVRADLGERNHQILC